MRKDALGFFWQDLPAVKPPKVEKPKRTPPERTWEREDYLPGLEEALRFDVPMLTDVELVCEAMTRSVFVFDIECYYNYFLIAFKSLKSGKVIYFEQTADTTFDKQKVSWMLRSFCLVSFNGNHYDVPILSLAMAGKDCVALKVATNEIIVEQLRTQDVLRRHKVKLLKLNHIDLIELAPLHQSLKMCAGRLHAERMQDLPFAPETLLSAPQIAITRLYCVNDLRGTELLYHALEEGLALRESMGREYHMDLRSKSDAQIAEAVITEEVGRMNGTHPRPPNIEIGTQYWYRVPHFLQFQSPLMQWALELVRSTPFIVGEDGAVGTPPQLKDLQLRISGSVYRMGIGGLHSSEQCAMHIADDHTILCDRDVESYYPRIILNQGLFPQHLGSNFLSVYRQIVNRRLQAKRTGDKIVADSLKITINGSYGKFGSKYSALYSPDLIIQVTMTGQLSLLMLIERLELAGIPVVSANTDGIVIKCPAPLKDTMLAIIAQWESDTGFVTEETLYKAIYSKDVNNYIAVKPDGKMKMKGAYAKSGLAKNPANQICMDAVYELLTKGTPVADTILGCKDIRKFVNVRTVNGGAVKDGQYLGKSVRWYYAAGEEGEIVYARSGNKVPRTDGARPLMDLPQQFPADVDLDWYVGEAEKILKEIGYA